MAQPAEPLFWIGPQERGLSFQLFLPDNPFINVAADLRGPIIATAISSVAVRYFKNVISTNIFILVSCHLATRIAKKLFNDYPLTSLFEKGALEVYRQIPYVFIIALAIIAVFSETLPLLTITIACMSGVLSGMVIEVYRTYARILQHE